MKIVALDTLRPLRHPNLLLVRLRTDEGLVGLGETFFGAQAVEAYLHESAAPVLLGANPTDVTAITRSLTSYVGYQGAGAETRGASAVNLALWDLFGRATAQPLFQLLGGRVRPDIPVYNTCAGSRYVQRAPQQSVANWGLPSEQDDGPYEDLQAFLTRPDELAEDLLSQGVGCMKIWPFDEYAERGGGTRIERDELAHGVGLVERIRAAVGLRIDIMIELHGLWNLPAATRIARALEDLDVYWLEDPLRPDAVGALPRLTAATSLPIAMGETVTGARAYQRLLAEQALDVAIVDITWTGGVSEALRIAQAADAFATPVAAHDCTGPLALLACTHLAVSQPNALIQETVRAYYHGWYGDLVTQLPPLREGRIAPPEGAGLGTDLHPDLDRRQDVLVRTSKR